VHSSGIKAFEVNALDYLLKPIAPARLEAALSRLGARPAASRLSQVFVRDGERCWIVRLPDIFLLESEGNYARLCFASERPLIRRSLNSIEQQLDPQMFFRANRRRILNSSWIESGDWVWMAGCRSGCEAEMMSSFRAGGRRI
jgi:two-component system, LytTR family, response regulator